MSGTRDPGPPAATDDWLTPARIAGAYVVVGLGLLVVSDLYWPRVIADVETLRRVQGVTRLLVVLTGAGVIYALLRVHRTERSHSERRYRQLLETSPAPINLFDEDGTTVWGNDAVLDLLGLEDRDELVGRSIFDFIHVEDHDLARGELRTVIRNGEATGPTRMQLRRADGELRDIRVATAPGRYEGRRIGQAVVIDDTQVLELETDLEAERRFVDRALDALQDAFFVLDAGGELVRWNATVESVTGYDAEALATRPVETLFVEADRDRVGRTVARALEEGEAALEATVETADGRTIEYEFRGRRLEGPDDSRRGMVGIGRDVSARTARDRHLWNVDRLLQHELRNKLNVVVGLAELLEAPEDADLEDPSERLLELTAEVLSLVDKNHEIVETLTGRIEPTAVDAVPVAERAVETVRSRYPDATVAVDLPASAAVTALPKLERTFVELLENAVQHHDDPAPTVSLSMTVGDRTVRVEVADDGPPIPAAERELVTGERAFDASSHTEGLGLWLVQATVAGSGGRLDFDVDPDGGNVVVVELPLALADPTSTAPGG